MSNFKSLEKKFGNKIEYLEETTSTNDIAREERFYHGDVIIAEYQTKGRGQRGNKWSSILGENLTFTIVLTPIFLTPDKQFIISKCVALALTDALRSMDIDAKIKWTNDIYVEDKKISGVLIENDITGSEISKSIVGIGFNVNQREFDPALPNPTSLSLIKNIKLDRTEVLDLILTALVMRFNTLATGNDISTEYNNRLYRRGELHTFRSPDRGEFKATIKEVRATGELILIEEDKEKSYLFKEVEFII